MSITEHRGRIDEQRLEAFVGHVATELGAALNAAFDTVFPQQRTAHARMELVQRLRHRRARETGDDDSVD